MAIFPCSVCNRGYRGPQQTIYPALSEGNETTRRKLRLCPGDFAELLDRLQSGYRRAQADFLEPELCDCPVCHEPVTDDRGLFFATVYATGQDRDDYWATVHDGCATHLARLWQLPLERP